MAWVYLFFASILEVAWTFSLKFMDVKKILAIKWLNFFNDTSGITVLLPLIGYLSFGLANAYFFSLAIKSIPMSTALATWMGISLIGLKLVDINILKQPWNPSQLLYMALILVGIFGLKTGN